MNMQLPSWWLSFNPFKKNIRSRQIESFPQKIGVKIKHILEAST